MGKYDLIKKLEKSGDLMEAIRQGIISTSLLNKKSIYEKYLHYKINNSKMDAYTKTSENCNVTVKYVRVIVKDFE